MPEKILVEIATRWMELWRGGDLSDFDSLHAENFVDRSPSERDNDRAAFLQSIRDLYAAFPDFAAVIDDLVTDTSSNKVTVRWSATGTHRGPFLGHPATGRVIRFQGMEIIRIEEGRIIERWGEWDGLSLLDQLSDSSE